MGLERLDHVNIKTNRLPEMIDWYLSVLGLESGPRPGFPFGGAWLYCAGEPIVHLVEVADEPLAIAPKIEHFAVRATGLDAFLGRLEAAGVAYEIGRPPGFPIIQVNIFDADRNHIHSGRRGSSTAPLTVKRPKGTTRSRGRSAALRSGRTRRGGRRRRAS